MSVAIAVIALFVIICVLVVAYVCLCLMTSSKDADEVERRLFNENLIRIKEIRNDSTRMVRKRE